MSIETETDSTSYELALSGDLTDAERAEYWQRAYERMSARNDELSLTIIRMEEALRTENAADEAFDAADEYTHRAYAEDWLNDPTGSLHVAEAWDRANKIREKAKALRIAVINAALPEEPAT